MIKPHGSDSLDPRLVSADRAQQLLAEAETLPSLLINSAAAANAVMLGAGYFNPLKGYMNLADALSVSTTMHNEDGLFWPVPVLNMAHDVSAIEGASRIALRDPNTDGNPIMAVMDVAAIESVSDQQIDTMAEAIFGTTDAEHPGVATFTNLGRFVVSGILKCLTLAISKQTFLIPSAPRKRFVKRLLNAVGTRLWHSKLAIQCIELMKNFAVWRWSDWMPMVW